MRVDLRLYALVDPERAGGRDLAVLARLVAQGGATLVQLRDKHSDTRLMVARARAIKAELAPLNVPLLINDRIDVALATGADGAHVGQDDMAAEDARRLLGADAIIGLSVKTVEQAAAAPIDLLDYVGIGGVFATSSKDNPSPPIGPSGLARIVSVFRRRASSAAMSSCPTCAPSAPAASATSTRSLTTSGTSNGLSASLMARAVSTMARVSLILSRNWMSVAPPSAVSRANSARSRPPARSGSTMALRRRSIVITSPWCAI